MTTLESYRYTALDGSGDKVRGTEKAASPSAAHIGPDPARARPD